LGKSISIFSKKFFQKCIHLRTLEQFNTFPYSFRRGFEKEQSLVLETLQSEAKCRK